MTKKPNKITYLDYASGAPIDREVQNLLSKTESVFYANPSSIHRGGLRAKKLIDDSRARIASLLYAHRDEIIFTGSGTESIALAILGTIANYELQNTSNKNKIPHIITSEIEHPAVLENCKMLEKNGKAMVTYIPVDEKGFINPKLIRENIKANTVLISIMYANNEIGTIQNIEEIAKQVRHYRKNNSSMLPYFHTDACQATNYLFMENVEKLGVDLMTFNSSKIYGPKGIACLYKKRNVELSPLYYGGGQEYGLRSGTESVSLIASFSLAFEKSIKMKKKESARLLKLRDYAIKKLLMLSKNSGYKIILNGDTENRLPNNINISVDEIKSELLVIELDAKGIEVSSKSACKSDEPDESYVISALRKAQGLKGDSTTGSLRITLGRDTKKEDLDFLVKTLGQILSKYKKWKVS